MVTYLCVLAIFIWNLGWCN